MLTSDLKEQGYKQGYSDAKKALSERGYASRKTIVSNTVVDEKKIRSELMEHLKVGRNKAFTLALIYAFAYDRGVLEAAYGSDSK